MIRVRWSAATFALCLALQACGGDDGGGTTPPDGPIAADPSAPVAGSGALPEFDDAASTYRRDHPDLPGIGISVDTVLLAFRLETTVAQANQVLAAEDATVAGGVAGTPGAASGIWILRLPTTTHAELALAVVRLENAPVVEAVVPDTLLDPLAVPGPNAGDPPSWTWDVKPSGPNWGHESVRMPQVWNLNDGVEREGGGHAVWVFDAGFDTTHADLANAVALGGVSPEPHGTHVAGTIGATFDDGYGVDGLDPFVKLGLKQTRSFGTALDVVDGAVKELAKAGTVPVVNMSIGYNFVPRGIDPEHGATKYILAKGAKLFQETMKALHVKGSLPLVIAAAGNDSGGAFGDVHTRRSSPMNAAAVDLGVANVISVEATTNVPVVRRATSSTGGHVSAPGEAIWSASVGPKGGVPAYQPGIPPFFEAKSGTSMAAPHVTGIASYLLAFDPLYPRPTLTENPIRELLVKYAVPVPNGAPGVDAFAAMVAANPARAFRYLGDIDDGTPDGNDRTTTSDARGDGKVDMRDFRRFRDWLSQIEGTGHLDGPFEHVKFDLNRDGLLEDFEKENVHPRGDFNGDGVLSRTAKRFVPALGDATDLDILLDRFQDDDYSAAVLPELLDSGDIAIDVSSCLARPGVGAVRVRAVDTNTSETLEERAIDGAKPTQIMSVRAPVLVNLELVALDTAGVDGSRSELLTEAVLIASDMAWKADCVVLSGVSPKSGQAGDELTLEGGGFALELADVHVVFENSATGEKLPATITGATLVGLEVTAIRVLVPDGVSAAASWKVYVEQPYQRSNALDFSVEDECLVDLHKLVQNPTKSFALDVNQSGAVLVSVNSPGAWAPAVVSPDESVKALPCAGKGYGDALDEQGRVASSSAPGSPAWFWDPNAPSTCVPLSNTAYVMTFGIANGTVVGTDSARAAIWPNPDTKVVIPYTPGDPIPRWANDINQAGAVVGYADKTYRTAFLWSGNTLTYLPLPTAFTAYQSDADVINDLGVIAGRVDYQTIVLWSSPTTPPSVFHQTTDAPEVNGINNAAEVVGSMPTASKGFLWLQQPAYAGTQAGFYHLDDFVADPAWKIKKADAINDSGQVAATALHEGIDKAVLINLAQCKPASPPSPK